MAMLDLFELAERQRLRIVAGANDRWLFRFQGEARALPRASNRSII